jgi:tetratricopeptide (TPR) repeat protein
MDLWPLVWPKRRLKALKFSGKSIDLRSQYSVLMNDIVDIAKENNIVLPDEFYQFISVFFRKVTDYDESLRWVNKCTHKNIWYYNLKSSILIRQKNFKEALILIDEAIEKYNDKENLWHRKAIAHDSLGEKEKAEASYLQGIKFNKGCSHIHFHFGILLYENNRFNEAYEQFILASKIEKSVRYSFWEAKSLIKKGDETRGNCYLKDYLKNILRMQMSGLSMVKWRKMIKLH